LRIYKNKWFTRFARKERISAARLRQAVEDAEAGKIEERAFKELAKLVFGLSDEDLAKLVETGAYEKVEGDD
jgi:hypothetical protein